MNCLYIFGVVVFGGVGGFFGLLVMLVEVLVIIGIIFCFIVDIVCSEGELIRDMDILMVCIEVFVFGGKFVLDDVLEFGYYVVCMVLV